MGHMGRCYTNSPHTPHAQSQCGRDSIGMPITDRLEKKKKAPKLLKGDVPRQTKVGINIDVWLQGRTVLPQMTQRDKDAHNGSPAKSDWLQGWVVEQADEREHWVIEVESCCSVTTRSIPL